MTLRKTTTFLVAAAALCGVLSAPPADAARVYIKVGPPAVRVEVRGVAPSPRHVWLDGYWRWEGGTHVWVPGRWELGPRPGAAWIPGHWKHTRHGWYWVDGHWR